MIVGKEKGFFSHPQSSWTAIPTDDSTPSKALKLIIAPTRLEERYFYKNFSNDNKNKNKNNKACLSPSPMTTTTNIISLELVCRPPQ